MTEEDYMAYVIDTFEDQKLTIMYLQDKVEELAWENHKLKEKLKEDDELQAELLGDLIRCVEGEEQLIDFIFKIKKDIDNERDLKILKNTIDSITQSFEEKYSKVNNNKKEI